MEANGVSNVLSTQVASAAATVWIMQRLKNAHWFPLLQHGQKEVSRAVSLVVAFFISIGIGYTWNRNDDGSHLLILAIPTMSVLVVGVWHWFQQFVYHEIIYQSTINKISITSEPEGIAIPAKISAEGKMVVPIGKD